MTTMTRRRTTTRNMRTMKNNHDNVDEKEGGEELSAKKMRSKTNTQETNVEIPLKRLNLVTIWC